MSHHSIAWVIIVIAAVMVVVDGVAFSVVQHITVWHGVYCIWMTAITVGGDVQPVSWGYLCLAFAPFPLIAAAFTLFTSALSAIHVRKAKKEILGSTKEGT